MKAYEIIKEKMEDKTNRSDELKMLQALPLEVKIKKTEQRIKEFYEYLGGNVYISFSGGKDSTVLLDIARKIYPNVRAMYIDTGLEYPEIRQFVKSHSNVDIIRPDMRFDQVIEKYGYPVISKEVSNVVCEARKGLERKDGKCTYRIQRINGTLKDKNGNKSQYNCEKWKFLLDAPFKISNKCCDVMKKNPAKKYEKQTGLKPIIATMAEESRLRRSKWLRKGCNSFDGKTAQSNPMSFWTEQDVLNYLATYNVPYCSVYGSIVEEDQLEGQMCLDGYNKQHLKCTGCKRTGCMFCMYGCHLEDPRNNRFVKMKKTHPKQYDYCINKLGLGKVLDYIRVNY